MASLSASVAPLEVIVSAVLLDELGPSSSGQWRWPHRRWGWSYGRRREP
jgi:hypothetical protein